MMLKLLLVQRSKSFFKTFSNVPFSYTNTNVGKSWLIVEIGLGTNYLKLDRLVF